MDEQDTSQIDFTNAFSALCAKSISSNKHAKLATKIKCIRKNNIKPLPSDASFGLMKLSQVLALMQVSRSNWLEGVKNERYPAPVRLSDRRVAWRISDLKAFIDSL